jgi:transposase
MAKLRKEEIVTLQVLHEKGESGRAIARRLGVSEGTVRYHLGRAAAGSGDGRVKRGLIEASGLGEVVRHWWEEERERLGDRRPHARALWEYLVAEHGFSGSYKSVRKYVGKVFPGPARRTYRRIETAPGAQTQSDWCEVRVDVGGAKGPEKMYGFVMTLSHSRKSAVVWSRSMDQLSWHRVHNEAYRRLGGVAAVNRIDNLKTGVSRGAGAWGVLNESYRVYARSLGFHIDPHEAREPQQKGKVERCVGIVKGLGISTRKFDSLEALQEWTDARLLEQESRRTCAATGKSVRASWEAELSFLRPLPALLPEPFDLVRECLVYKDCTLSFEGRQYTAPFYYVDRRLEVRGCSGKVQIVDRESGQVLKEYPRGTAERILIDEQCYEGASTDWALAPKRLGKVSRKLQELASSPAPMRAIEIYAALAEVCR